MTRRNHMLTAAALLICIAAAGCQTDDVAGVGTRADFVGIVGETSSEAAALQVAVHPMSDSCAPSKKPGRATACRCACGTRGALSPPSML